MKTSFQTIYGIPGDLTVKNVPVPILAKNEVLIRVYATTVNRSDLAMVTAIPFIMRFGCGLFKPKKNTPGTDFAGIVTNTGDSVTKFQVGDHVFGFDDRGVKSQAEYTALSEDGHFIKMPDHNSFEEIVACVEGAHYARNFINKVKAKTGQKVLVNGGTGSIGSAMIQLLVAQGLTVTAVCPGKDFALVKSLGASALIDYESEDFTKIDDQFDYVFDAVGKSSFFKCRHLMKAGGIYISSELGYLSQNIWLTLLTPILNKIIFWKRIKKVRFPMPYDIKKSLKSSLDLYSAKKLIAVIDQTFHLDEVVQAYKYVGTGTKVGNVILKIKNQN